MTNELKDSAIETTAQIKILHVLSDQDKRLRPLENLVNGLDRGMFSQVVCYLRGNDKVRAELEKLGHDVISLDISKKKLRKFQPWAVLQLARIIKERGIDIVHCQRHKSTVYGTLAAYMVGKQVKVIGHEQGCRDQGPTDSIGRRQGLGGANLLGAGRLELDEHVYGGGNENDADDSYVNEHFIPQFIPIDPRIGYIPWRGECRCRKQQGCRCYVKH